MTSCRLCGKCCFYIKEGRLKKCKHLVKLKSGKTLCRIYTNRNRVGIPLDDGIVCTERKDSFFDYEGCPYNTGKQIFEEVVG